MPDPRLMSLHLEAVPSRRDAFRAARDRLRAACGDHTIAGDLADLEGDDPGDGPTVEDLPGVLFYLRDGATLHPLTLGVNGVGRLSDNAVVLRDEHVSRRHCAVVVHRDGRAEVHDVASKNGTIVNGRQIAGPTRLRPGDLITLCGKHLVFVAAGPAG